MLANFVAPDRIAETVAKIEPAGEPQIDSDMRTESWTTGGKFGWRKAGSAS